MDVINTNRSCVRYCGYGLLNPSHHLWWLASLAVIVAFCSASQDIVFDAYKTDILKADERGTGAAVSVLGYRIAMLVSGAWHYGLQINILAGKTCTG